MSGSFEHGDLRSLARDLDRLERPTRAGAKTALERTARSVKDAWNEKLPSEGHAKLTSKAITYDIHEGNISFGVAALDEGDVKGSTLTAEIGAVTGSGKQAGVVRILENGAPGRGTAPRGYGASSLHENEADFEHGLDEAVRLAERSVGL